VSFRGPELLGPDHVVAGFDCGKTPLNDWLIRRGLPNLRSGASRTWVATDEAAGRVIGYYSSATAAIIRSDATKRAGRNQPEDIPGILLARLAVDRDYAGQGLGSALLKRFVLKAQEVSAIVGARVLLVHAQDDEARQFYLRYAFEPSPIDDLTLMRVITDIG
jgi:GNAT superfamily N-acetyltransferase